MKQRVTEETALQVARDYKATKDLAGLIRDVSGFGWHFGKYSGYNRKLFTRALIQALDKGSNRVTARRVNMAVYPNGKPCPGCNWSVTNLYSINTNDIEEEELCSTCFMDLLVQDRRWII